ncbi:N-formylglutamate deformylase [Litoreibacter sp.]|nr:N-formylglutamate deformylase [Litoreibacter sp.]
MNVVEVTHGDSPVVLAQPHGGTFFPADLMSRLNAGGRALSDTDWHITRLYDGLLEGATVVRSNVHRYVIDANRDPSGGSLYPGQNTTTLCPVTDFDGRDIWQAGQAPSQDEVEARRVAYHAPYHDAVSEELQRVIARHGVAILYDCHSIRSEISFLFEGVLPVFSIGTNEGVTCAADIERLVKSLCDAAAPNDTVLNGRFKGGWTTRHYGQPHNGVHAIQMELAQRAYMDEAAPWTYQQGRAATLRPVLAEILNALDQIARSGALTQEGI